MGVARLDQERILMNKMQMDFVTIYFPSLKIEEIRVT